MGYIKNHAIVVTATYDNWIEKAHAKASEIFGAQVTPVSPESINGSRSFLVPPDGSKEGWGESEQGDARREQFKAWLRAQRYEDHSSPLAWVELSYGGDDDEPLIIDDSKEAWRAHYEA